MLIDLHNHLLPGLDDGATDLSSSLAMARLAVANGISHMVCTPHIHPGRYDNDAASIRRACDAFRVALKEAGIPLRVGAAAEVRFCSEVLTGVCDGSIPFLGNWQGLKVLLLEFPHGEVPFAAERMTQWLLDNGIVPMLAHPERNKGLLRKPSKLSPFIRQGCLLQITASSLVGNFGAPARQLAHALLEQRLVNVIASDAHNLRHRPPELRPGLERAVQVLGEYDAQRLVIETPWQIAQQHFI